MKEGHWDISAGERLEVIKRFCWHGLEHWGSDEQGVDRTRRFLLAWLSFLCRYVPYGLLDRPQRINQRPFAYVGRSDLETLLGSPKPQDWIKISEMFLGPVPEGYTFIPKHKSNAYTECFVFYKQVNPINYLEDLQNEEDTDELSLNTSLVHPESRFPLDWLLRRRQTVQFASSLARE